MDPWAASTDRNLLKCERGGDLERRPYACAPSAASSLGAASGCNVQHGVVFVLDFEHLPANKDLTHSEVDVPGRRQGVVYFDDQFACDVVTVEPLVDQRVIFGFIGTYSLDQVCLGCVVIDSEGVSRCRLVRDIVAGHGEDLHNLSGFDTDRRSDILLVGRCAAHKRDSAHVLREAIVDQGTGWSGLKNCESVEQGLQLGREGRDCRCRSTLG